MSRTASKLPTDSTTSRKASDPSKTAKLSDPSARTALSSKDSANGARTVPSGQPTKQSSASVVDQKKLPRRGSKPIINWFQRKLAVRARRASDGTPPPPNGVVNRARPQPTGNAQPTKRVVSTPGPTSPAAEDSIGRDNRASMPMPMPSISLNEADLSSSEEDHEDASTYTSSAARRSEGAPSSAMEADDDASMRPIAPSMPPSPTGSRSSASYLSDPHTFHSLAASTKPTTVLSVDLPPAGVAHIAQAPAAPARAPHLRQSSTGTGSGAVGSGGSITFSALPPSPASRTTSPSRDPLQNDGAMTTVQAPLHTSHHPRNNPRPSSPPLDNASMLTLASSAFAVPGTRMGVGPRSIAPSGLGASDSASQFDNSMMEAGDAEESIRYGDDERLDNDVERDVNASVRALRPRSSRQGSWGSEMSRWSAKIGGTGAGTSLAGKSLWTNGSTKTGGQFSVEGADGGYAQPNSPIIGEPAGPSITSPIALAHDSDGLAASPTSPVAERSLHQNTEDEAHVILPGIKIDTQTTPATVLLKAPANGIAQPHEGDTHSIAATDNQTDFWVSAPSTPIG